jgi:hypothetical protein
MKLKHILAALCGFLALACGRDDVALFETDEAGIYFERVKSYSGSTKNYTDSVALSFANAAADQTSMVSYVDIMSLGRQRDYDRPVRVSVDAARTTAIEGVHYQVRLDTLGIGAGKSSTRLGVRFLRTPDLMDGTVTLAFKLEENDHFKCLFPEYKNTNSYAATGRQISGVEFIFAVSEQYTEPFYWTLFAGEYFGAWTPRKFVLVNTVCGYSAADWQTPGTAGSKVSLGRFSFAARAVREYLQKMADAGTPVTDSDGSYMQIGANYWVDYSAFE